MIELFINGTLIEGLEDEIALTKAVNDLGELPTRQGEFSNTINIPMTKSNCLALGSIEDVNSLSTVINSLNNYELYDYGVLVSTGYARVISLNETIEINLFSGNADWSSLLKDKSVRDIDVSDLNYSITPTQVAARRELQTEMALPNVWYGGPYMINGTAIPNATNWNTMFFLPCFFIAELVKRMFAEINYTSIINLRPNAQALYDKMITIHSKQKWMYDLEGYNFHVTLAESTVFASDTFFGGGVVNKKADDIEVVRGFPYTVTKDFVPIATPTDLKVLTFESDRNLDATLGGYIKIQVLSVTTPGTVLFVAQNSNTAIGILNVTTTGIFTVNFQPSVGTPSGTTYRYYILDGTTVFTYAILEGELYSTNDEANQASQYASDVDEYVANVEGCLPAIKQSDLLITLFNIFGIITSTNVYDRVVKFSQLDTLIDNIPNAIDWTDKLDLSEEPEILFDFFDNYFQRNLFRYKPDDKDENGVAGTTYGQGFIDYDNKNLDVEDAVFESVFSAIIRRHELIPPIANCDSRAVGDLNFKIGYVKLTTDNLITQQGQSAPTNSNEVFFDDLLFTNLINENYNTLKRVFANSRAIKLLVRLSRTDYQSIDFTTPIFIDIVTERHGNIRGHFYINEIEQYAVGKRDSTYVTLVKID